MKHLNTVTIGKIQRHLETLNSGVLINSDLMPGNIADYQCFHGVLEDNDIEKLILWWEFEKLTATKSCRITDLLSTAEQLPRVASFINDDQHNGLIPQGLQSNTGAELVLLTCDLRSDWLYIIDGNHRVIAHFIQCESFENVECYVCVHPEIEHWNYIPKALQRAWKGVN